METASKEIDIGILRDTLNKILKFIEVDLGKTRISLPNDLYWEVDRNDLYDLLHKQPKLNCGNLGDDWEFILAAYKDDSQAIPLLLLHIAPILNALSTLVPSFQKE